MEQSESGKTEQSKSYIILIIGGERCVTTHHNKHIEIIKKYCNQDIDIDIDNTTFENLNQSMDYLSTCNIYNEYKLVPPNQFDMCDNECDTNHEYDSFTQSNKIFNDEHNNKYDYIIFENCPISYFKIEYFKYYNMLKLYGYLIFYSGVYYFNSNNIISSCYDSNRMTNREEETQHDIDTCEIYDDHRICDSSVCLREYYELQFLHGCSKIFTRINKYIFKKDIDILYDMNSVIRQFFEHIFNFNPNIDSDTYKNKYIKYKHKYKHIMNNK